MIRFGTVGTNWITDRFISSAALDPRFKIQACYSRKEETAAAFAQKHQIPSQYTSLEKMAEEGEIDAVYIASPNLYHYEQCLLFLKNKIPVLCEKPMATDGTLIRQMIQTAKDNDVLLVHAMKNLFEPRLQVIHELLPQLGEIRLVLANRCRYSSRYDDYRAGIIQNAFNPALGNGAAMDIGIYLIQPTVYYFGKPIDITAKAVMLENGIDGAGTIIAQYAKMQAVLNFSKISTSRFMTEIQGEEGTLYIGKEENSVLLAMKGQEPQKISYAQEKPDMFYESKLFMDCIESGIKESPISRYEDAIISLDILDEYRKQINYAF